MRIPDDPQTAREAWTIFTVSYLSIIPCTIFFILGMKHRKEFIVKSRGISFLIVSYVGVVLLMIGAGLEPFTAGVVVTQFDGESLGLDVVAIIVFLVKGGGCNLTYTAIIARICFINYIFLLKPFHFWKAVCALFLPWILTRPLYVLSEMGVIATSYYTLSFAIMAAYYLVVGALFIFKNYQIHRAQLKTVSFSNIQHFSDYQQSVRQFIYVVIMNIIFAGSAAIPEEPEYHWLKYGTMFVIHTWVLTLFPDYLLVPLWAIYTNNQAKLKEYDLFRKKQLTEARLVANSSDKKAVDYFDGQDSNDDDDITLGVIDQRTGSTDDAHGWSSYPTSTMNSLERTGTRKEEEDDSEEVTNIV